MGEYDSTETRVVPVFNHLLSLDGTGALWLERLMRLDARFEVATVPQDLGMPVTNDLPAWGKGKERSLAPPLGLLEWLVQNISPEAVARKGGQGETAKKRQALAAGDPEVLREALNRLRQLPVGKPVPKWIILEGNSSPDVFLETDTFVLVVEGKRTETYPTNHTDWMQYRPQLIRHMDGAYEVAKGRAVLSLLLVEGFADAPMTVPEKWTRSIEQYLQPNRLALSLPHRSASEQQEIAAGVLGAATWQRVCDEFSIPWPPV